MKTKAVSVALGVPVAGEKELFGLWVRATEGATFWLAVCTDLHQLCDYPPDIRKAI